MATATTAISAATSTKRYRRNLSGGAYGSPYFAAMKPVLQSRDEDHRKHELLARVASVGGEEVQPHEVSAVAAYHGFTSGWFSSPVWSYATFALFAVGYLVK